MLFHILSAALRHSEKKLAGRKMLGNLVETTKFDVTELRSLRRRFEETAARHHGKEAGSFVSCMLLTCDTKVLTTLRWV